MSTGKTSKTTYHGCGRASAVCLPCLTGRRTPRHRNVSASRRDRSTTDRMPGVRIGTSNDYPPYNAAGDLRHDQALATPRPGTGARIDGDGIALRQGASSNHPTGERCSHHFMPGAVFMAKQP